MVLYAETLVLVLIIFVFDMNLEILNDSAQGLFLILEP